MTTYPDEEVAANLDEADLEACREACWHLRNEFGVVIKISSVRPIRVPLGTDRVIRLTVASDEELAKFPYRHYFGYEVQVRVKGARP